MAYLQDAYFANLNVVYRTGGRFCLPAGKQWTLPESSFVQDKFYYVTGGSCYLCIEGKEYIAHPGDWFYIPAGTRHRYYDLPGEQFQKYWVHFDLYPNGNMAKLLALPARVQVGSDTRAAEQFEILRQAIKSDLLVDKLQGKAALLNLIALYVELAQTEEVMVNGDEQSRIQRVLSYMHENLAKPMTNRELAEQCHMHPNHFIRYFAKKTGQTPGHYLTQQRMEAAKRLLEETKLPIAGIMEQVGIQESSHFARLFRRYYSLTPTQYRKRFTPADE